MQIKFDPVDISKIFVLSHRTARYFAVPAVDRQYAKGLTLWQHKVIKKNSRDSAVGPVRSADLRKAKAELFAMAAVCVRADRDGDTAVDLADAFCRQATLRVEQLSRLVTAKQAAALKKDLAEGRIDIMIGTHSLLGKGVAFKHLGLLIVDEEQHFGVTQKERLKQLKANVHVLTLTATPIPRTLQLALAGVREMSVIATPPVDRLAVRTFVLPYDPVVVREAILRELHRGGQCFYVAPRIGDLDEVHSQLRDLGPEVKVAGAHGREPGSRLAEGMGAARPPPAAHPS